jgi:hypothetical protein
MINDETLDIEKTMQLYGGTLLYINAKFIYELK